MSEATFEDEVYKTAERLRELERRVSVLERNAEPIADIYHEYGFLGKKG